MLTPDDLRAAEFRTVRRGYDPDEVESFLYRLALEMETVAMYLAGGVASEIADSPPATSTDPIQSPPGESALFALGAETARLVESAAQVASELRAHAARAHSECMAGAERQATEMLSAVRAEIIGERDRFLSRAAAEASAAARDRSLATIVLTDARKTAEDLVSEARVTAEDLVSEARVTAEDLVSEARVTAEDLVSQSRSRAARLLDEAQRRADVVVEEGRRSASRTLVEARLLAEARIARGERSLAAAEARAEALRRLADARDRARVKSTPSVI